MLPKKVVINRWLSMIKWCELHQHNHIVSFRWNSGEGYCDDTAEDTIEIETPEGKLVLLSRPNESLGSDERRIKRLEAEIDKLINVDDVREDSDRIISRKLQIEESAALLFSWGFNRDRKVESKEIQKKFAIE